MFTTNQSDPTRKATYKYAKKLQKAGRLQDAIAVRTIIENFGVVHKGVKLVISPKTKGGSYVRHDKRQKNNALAGYLIHKYEEFVSKGMDSVEALSRATFAPDVAVWVDTGVVGNWASDFVAHKVIVNETKITIKLRANGPRKAKADSDRARYKAIGDAHRAELAEIREQGKVKGAILAQVRAALREMGTKNV
jgi:hypothetical protein